MTSPLPPSKPTDASSASRGTRVKLALLLAALALLAYLPSLPGEFIWDDDAHVTQNDTLHDLDGLRRIWVPSFEPSYKPHTPQYYPLAFTALWLEYRLFEHEPLGYHLVNLVLHVLNALLVWAVFARLRVPGAWLLGALFALHPMHVETAAWAMEIKNLLSASFYLLAALAWFRFDPPHAAAGDRKRAWYALALALFVCALLSKSITATLPAALILAMLYGRRRIDLRRLLPLVPFFVVGISLALNTAFLERNHVGAKGLDFEYGLAEKILIASRVLLFYPAKLLAPWPQLFNYERWEIDPGDPLAWWPALVVSCVAALAVVAYRRGARGPALALAYFAGTLFPALGLITYYPMIFAFVADHFCYLPSLGILALVASAATRLPRTRTAQLAVGGGLLVVFGGFTGLRAWQFRSAESLYRQTLAHNPDAWLVRTLLALIVMGDDPHAPNFSGGAASEAELREAEELLRGGIAQKDDYALMHLNLGLCLRRQGRTEESLESFERAVALDEGQPDVLTMASVVNMELGKRERAERYARRALQYDPRDARVKLVLADLARERGEAATAREHLVEAFAEAPDEATRELAGARLFSLFLNSQPQEILASLERLRAAGAVPSIGLEQLGAQALFQEGRRAEALTRLEALLVRAEREGRPELVQPVRAQLAELRRRNGEAP